MELDPQDQISLLREQLAQLSERTAHLARELQEAEAAAQASTCPDKPDPEDSLFDFLLHRIAEDEEAAEAAKAGPWTFVPDSSGDGIYTSSDSVVNPGGYNGRYGAIIDHADGEHIVRWDPVHVLAECEAKRLIVQDCPLLEAEDEDQGRQHVVEQVLDWVMRTLALPYAGHANYRPEWRARWGQRFECEDS